MTIRRPLMILLTSAGDAILYAKYQQETFNYNKSLSTKCQKSKRAANARIENAQKIINKIETKP